jgi:hypothetical protein
MHARRHYIKRWFCTATGFQTVKECHSVPRVCRLEYGVPVHKVRGFREAVKAEGGNPVVMCIPAD